MCVCIYLIYIFESIQTTSAQKHFSGRVMDIMGVGHLRSQNYRIMV